MQEYNNAIRAAVCSTIRSNQHPPIRFGRIAICGFPKREIVILQCSLY